MQTNKAHERIYCMYPSLAILVVHPAFRQHYARDGYYRRRRCPKSFRRLLRSPSAAIASEHLIRFKNPLDLVIRRQSAHGDGVT